ncbi:MAG: DNA-binding NtrC family response regulator [Candidatus Latescibacterota bacterium]|jgi:DNA-binding NtrC family response regulator
MSDQEIKILVVSQGVDIVQRMRALFAEASVEVSWEGRIARVLDLFERAFYDILLITDTIVKDGTVESVEVLEVLAAKCPATQVLFLVDPGNIDIVSTALQAGTYQYIKQPVSDGELRMVVETALEQRPQYGDNLLSKIDDEQHSAQLIGDSQPMRDVYRYIRQAASSDIPVLLSGETGTGKDLVAHAIHLQSARRDVAYIPLNVAALPPELVSSELFGHEKGAFTGASERRAGVFEQAHNGTVFLDEIGSIDERTQVSLLRLLEQKRFHRLGGRSLVASDVRLIAATNANLPELVQEGTFREDLLFRLDVFNIHLPPLRERHGDLPQLLQAFLTRFNKELQKDIHDIAPQCLAALEAYPWPGNIRELKNVIQRASLICQGHILQLEHLPARLQKGTEQKPQISFEVGTALENVEREMIAHTLQYTNNNRLQTARLLGISRRTLYNKIARHKLD